MLPTINTILYASDLENNARQAFAYAVALAKVHHAKITFLHVMEPLGHTVTSLVRNIVPQADFEKLQQEGYRKIKQEIHARIKNFCDEECGSAENGKKIIAEVLILEGYPGDMIIQQADQMEASLVIMGTHNHSGIERALIGSVAHKVTTRIKRPLLLIPISS